MCHIEDVVIYPMISNMWEWLLPEEVTLVTYFMESYIRKYNMINFTENVHEKILTEQSFSLM